MSNNKLDTFHDRLIYLLNKEDSATSFAKKIGVTEGTIRNYLRKKTFPRLDHATAIAEATGVSLDWLWYGTTSHNETEKLSSSENLVSSENFEYISRINVNASAGYGQIQENDIFENELIAFRRDWLKSIGVTPKNAQALTVRGDSMSPTILDGDLLLVDRAVNKVYEEGIYVITFGETVLVKRIQFGIKGMILKSDNPSYIEQIILPGELDNIRIEGRVRWFGRTV